MFTVEDMARLAHEANRVWCQANGDMTQFSWEGAPAWQRASASQGVIFIRNDPDNVTPEASHDSWMAQKIRDGWAYGPVKDAERKEHPCMVPYFELPSEQRAKDHLFGAIVRACLEANRVSAEA